MKRDMDLMQSILLALEEDEGRFLNWDGLYQPEFKKKSSDNRPWTDMQILEHVKILVEEKLIKVGFIIGTERPAFLRMTHNGHKFIADAQNEGIWKKAKAMFGDTSLAVLKQGLVKIATGWAY